MQLAIVVNCAAAEVSYLAGNHRTEQAASAIQLDHSIFLGLLETPYIIDA